MVIFIVTGRLSSMGQCKQMAHTIEPPKVDDIAVKIENSVTKEIRVTTTKSNYLEHKIDFIIF